MTSQATVELNVAKRCREVLREIRDHPEQNGSDMAAIAREALSDE